MKGERGCNASFLFEEGELLVKIACHGCKNHLTCLMKGVGAELDLIPAYLSRKTSVDLLSQRFV